MRARDLDRTTAGHRTVPHTADLILEAWAPTVEQCLAEAVAALTDSCADTSNALPTGRHTFRLAAGSDEQTLVAVLEEVLYVLDAHGQVPVTTHLEAMNGSGLSGWFDVISVTETPLIGSAPKGIARSGLSIHPDAGGWRCTATVDV